jgi:hypothetical protein
MGKVPAASYQNRGDTIPSMFQKLSFQESGEPGPTAVDRISRGVAGDDPDV